MKSKNKYNQLPTLILIALGLPSLFVASYSGWILNKGVPMFYEAALLTQQLGLKGFMVALILVVVFVVFFSYSSIAITCQKIIRERHFS